MPNNNNKLSTSIRIHEFRLSYELNIAVIGINVIDDMRYGKVIRIEDFMVCLSNRGIGAGKMLLKWVDWQSLKFKAEIILSNLSSERKESHKIFLREGFEIDGISFKK